MVDVVLEFAQRPAALGTHTVTQVSARDGVHHTNHIADEGVQDLNGFAGIVQDVQELARLAFGGQAQIKSAVGHGAHAPVEHLHGGGHVLLHLGNLCQHLGVEPAQACRLRLARKVTFTHAGHHRHGLAEDGLDLVQHVVDAPGGFDQAAAGGNGGDAGFELTLCGLGQHTVDVVQLRVFARVGANTHHKQHGHDGQQGHQRVAVRGLPQRNGASNKTQQPGQAQPQSWTELKGLGGRG